MLQTIKHHIKDYLKFSDSREANLTFFGCICCKFAFGGIYQIKNNMIILFLGGLIWGNANVYIFSYFITKDPTITP